MQTQRIGPAAAQVVVEVAQHRAQRQRLDPGFARAAAKALRPGPARAVAVGGDVEPPQTAPETAGRRDGRQRARRSSAWRAAAMRSESIVSMPSPAAIDVRVASASRSRNARHGRAGRPWRGAELQRAPCRLRPGASQVRCTPMMRPAVIGDGGDQRRAAPASCRPPRGSSSQGWKRSAAVPVSAVIPRLAQIGLGRGAAGSGGTWRRAAARRRSCPRRHGLAAACRPIVTAGGLLRPGQVQERPRLVRDIAEGGEAAARADEIEQIAMLAGRGVGPFAGGALAAVRAVQPDEERAAGIARGIADQPVAPFAPAVRRDSAGIRFPRRGQGGARGRRPELRS